MMPALSLRTRLLAGLALVAIVLVVIAWTITTTTRAHLIDQVDDQLRAAIDPIRDGRFGRPGAPVGLPPASDVEPPGGLPASPERLSAMFEGIVVPDRGLVTFFEPNLPGQQYSPPDVDGIAVADPPAEPFTVDAVDGDVEYRVLAVPGAGGVLVRALPLAEVDDTVDRLILVEAIGLAAVLAVLAAVAWWVIRLGIRPIRAMAHAADDITDDDLSARLPEPDARGTEAAALAHTLNTMLGRLETAVDERRRSEDRLRQFVSDASHELRTPVTTIQGYADLYRSGGLRDTSALDDAMRRTEQEARRMARLVDDMLTLAKLDQQRPHDAAAVDVGAIVSDTVADTRMTAADHTIVDRIEPELVVIGDEDRLRQVITNVVGNAAIHTPADTTIAVTARHEGSQVVVEVADDGPGVDVEHLERLTERFYRADPSRSRRQGGSGLGLAIVAAATDAHGGTLDITSEPGEGTTVTLRFPAGRRPGSTST